MKKRVCLSESEVIALRFHLRCEIVNLNSLLMSDCNCCGIVTERIEVLEKIIDKLD